jgi:hypothetical protein
MNQEIAMRQLTSATLAAAIALAFATAASAATTPSKPSINNMNASGTFFSSSPKIPGGQNAAPAATTTTTTTTTVAPANTTTVDVRNQQTLAAVAANHAVGSTSSLGPLAGASTVNGIAPGTTSGASAGTTTGTTGTGTETGTGGVVGTTSVLPFAVPAFGTPDVTSSGVALASTTAPILAGNGVFASDVYGTPVLSANVVTTDQAANDAAVNRALRQVSRDRARIGRNGQLLYSIAPRTNVDRSNEMPDDGPSPALSGYNSALAR